MNTHRKTAIVVGILFIIATVTSILGYLVILEPILNVPDHLTNISKNETQMIIGILIDSINSIAVVVIPVMLFPIFKKHNEALALGYLASRIIESLILIIGAISLLSLVTLSQEYMQAGSPTNSYFLPASTLLLAIDDWTFLLGPGVAFSFTALILNYLLYQSQLVPRFLSAWGLLGAILLLTADLLAIFFLSTTSTVFILLTLPIALQEMVFAIWLIVKGFNTAA